MKDNDQATPVVVDDAAELDDTMVVHVAAAVVVKPGDHILVRVHPDWTEPYLSQFKAEMHQRFPGSEVTVIAAEDMVVIQAPTLESEARPPVELVGDRGPDGGPRPAFDPDDVYGLPGDRPRVVRGTDGPGGTT